MNERTIYSSPLLLSSPVDTEGRTSCQPLPLNEATTPAFRAITVASHYLPPHSYPIETAQKWLTLAGKDGKMHKFPTQTILPKVQMTRHVPAKTLPRDVEIDRRRRQYAKVDVVEKLKEAGLLADELMPTQWHYYEGLALQWKHFLPLSFFDNYDYDCHSPQAWLSLGIVDDATYPVPAKAYLPFEHNQADYRWQYAAVDKYDPATELWRVKVLMDEAVYEIPKIQIMFLAEDPNQFVERLQKAAEGRNNAENLIMMEAIVDCVLLQDIRDERFLENPKVEALLRKYARSADATFFRNIRTEVYLVFEHLMACYEFEKFVQLLPKEFPSFNRKLIRDALPMSSHSKDGQREIASITVLKLDVHDLRYQVLRTTLYYIGAGIEAMGNVVAECQYIETLLMFVCHFARPLPLNDFLQSQQQHSNHVSNYLKGLWPQKTSAGISLVLRALGKGWLDIGLDKWVVYQMCKITRFILQTKLRMQESMQVLLENSLESFARFLTDPCLQFLDLEEDYAWTSDYINSEFPWKKPIFSLVISVSEEEKVVYSTDPEEFEPALLEIFKKALEKAAGVRCIDAETLTNLRFAPNLYLLTVELIEELFLRNNDLLQRCYRKAILPLQAYARKYDRFIHFYLLKVNDFMRAYEEAHNSSLQVKLDILEHKRLKQELRDILPATIHIGPFQIIVDPMKQYMIRKYIEIVKRLFEYYVQRMYDINDAILEECQSMYNKISERPQSIEHLYEIRDFGVTVPERVDQIRADIQIMWLEYDMLDSFFYNLSDTQFNMKWQAYAWPHTIMQRLSTLREEQKVDIDEFKRIHLSEIVGFEERLESLNEEVQAFSLVFDPNKVAETAVDIKKTWKVITALKKLGETLVYRQSLFEMEDLSLGFLEGIVESFTPYKNLWLTCLDFNKLEEATLGNPLTNVELDDVWAALDVIRKSLQKSREVFNEKLEIQAVADFYLEKVEAFVPACEAIGWLKNEHWLVMHWQELANRSGCDIKYTITINFLYLMKKGIMQHLDLIHEISDKAEFEADEYRRQWEEEERRQREAEEALLMRKAMRKCRRDILLDPEEEQVTAA